MAAHRSGPGESPRPGRVNRHMVTCLMRQGDLEYDSVTGRNTTQTPVIPGPQTIYIKVSPPGQIDQVTINRYLG